MAEPAERQRTVLRAPRVEFDLSALALGAAGYAAYQWSWPALASVLAVPEIGPVPPWMGLKSAFFSKVFGWIGLPYTNFIQQLAGSPGDIRLPPEREGGPTVLYDPGLPAWKYVVAGLWLLVLWSIVAGAIARIYAVRIARDESIGTGDALAFSFSNLRQFVQAPLFVAGAAAFSAGLVALAGAGSAIPVAGPFLEIVLYPLALVAGLVLVLSAIGGVFGLPVMQAALATERNGTLDAISRTFSYVFSRPVAYLVSVTLVAVVSTVILAFGGAFLAMTWRVMAFGGGWNPDVWNEHATKPSEWGAIQYGFVLGNAGGFLSLPEVDWSRFDLALWRIVSWFFTALATIVVNGYVLSYFVGGLTDTYFLLRREVDGIDDTEVYVEGAGATLGEPLPGQPAAPEATS